MIRVIILVSLSFGITQEQLVGKWEVTSYKENGTVSLFNRIGKERD